MSIPTFFEDLLFSILIRKTSMSKIYLVFAGLAVVLNTRVYAIPYLTVMLGDNKTIQGFRLADVEAQNGKNRPEFSECIMPDGGFFTTPTNDFPLTNNSACRETYPESTMLKWLRMDVFVLVGDSLKSAKSQFLCRIDGSPGATIDPTKQYEFNLSTEFIKHPNEDINNTAPCIALIEKKSQ
jgi:hypothetical protein